VAEYDQHRNVVFGIMQDITEHKRVEEALEESERKYRELVENANSIILRMDKTGNITFCNEFAQHFFGYSEDEILGKNVVGTIVPEVESTGRDLRALIEDIGINPDRYINNINENVRRDGDRVWVAWTNKPVLDKNGHVLEVLCIRNDITERKLSEEKRKDSEQLLQSIIQGYPIPAFMIGKDHRVIHWNRALEEVSGIGTSTVIGTSQHWRALYREERPCMADLLVDEDQEAIARWYAERASKSKILDEAYEATQFFPDLGETGKWLHFTATAVRNARGIIVGAIETLEDITDLKKAEEVLRESENRYRAIFENTGTAIIIVEEDSTISIANTELEKLTGYTREEIENKKSWTEFVVEEDLEGMLSQHRLRRVDADTARKQYEFRLVDRHGQIKDILLTVGMIAGTKRSVASLLDITDRKRAEEKYRSIFENAIEGIYQTTPEGRFISVNPAFARTIGYDSPEEVLQTITDISRQLYVNPEARTDLLRLLEEQDTVKEYETRFLRKDMSTAWVTLNVRTVRGSSGKLAYLEGTAEDVTDRKALEARLIQAQKIEAIGTLAGGIAHDFNNILSAVIGYTEMTKVKLEQPMLQGYLDQVLRACERARDLVGQILTFSRVTQQERKPIDIASLIEESLKLLRATIPSTITFHSQIYPGAYTVLADPTQIHQVLINLCTNAAHAMRERGGELGVCLDNVEITPQMKPLHVDLNRGLYVKLTVSDTGTGIAPEVISRIFDPFFTTKKTGEGTGLGLSVAYGIVKGCGGSITVHSEPGAGSVFSVYLPAITNIAEVTPDNLEPIPGGTERVLFVDDEEILVIMWCDILENLGYTVTATTESTKALEIFLSRPDQFDLVITDMTMPGMTGIDLSKEILGLRPAIPIILCTGFSELITEEKAKALGIRGFAMKPLRLGNIAELIRKALDKKEG
jgi:PAS domain S-box-containing protein